MSSTYRNPWWRDAWRAGQVQGWVPSMNPRFLIWVFGWRRQRFVAPIVCIFLKNDSFIEGHGDGEIWTCYDFVPFTWHCIPYFRFSLNNSSFLLDFQIISFREPFWNSSVLPPHCSTFFITSCHFTLSVLMSLLYTSCGYSKSLSLIIVASNLG